MTRFQRFLYIWLLPSRTPRWFRRWVGGHWERWWIDSPFAFTGWFDMPYGCSKKGAYRPGLARGTPVCEDW